MTKAEKREILNQALDNAYREISEAGVDLLYTTEFRTLIKNVQDMEWMTQSQLADDGGAMMPACEEPEPKKPKPVEPEKPEPVEPEKPETAAAPTPAEPDTPQYKMEDVRAALAKARGRGVNVSEIIRSFGADNFQQITKEQYPAIMNQLAAAGA